MVRYSRFLDYRTHPVYQDNMSCMSLIERGRSAAERTRHIAIRAGGPRVSESETPRDEGDVCEPSDEAAAGCTIQVRKTRAYGLGHDNSSLDYYNNI